MKRFALIGNPNCGKTTLFNVLTGSSAHVGNWPGVTVDKKEGVYKSNDEVVAIIDLPGIYSLSPYTPEEVISRNYILEEKPDCVINVVDVTNLERNLYLTTQLLEMDVPVIICLNMSDVLPKLGKKINPKVIEDNLKIPVVEVSALKESNIDILINRAIETSRLPRKGKSILEESKISHLVNDLTISFNWAKVDNPLFHAVKLIEKDEIEVKDHPDLLPLVEGFKKSFNDDLFQNDLEAIIADARYKYICKYLAKAISSTSEVVKEENEEIELSVSDKIDRVLTHKWLSIPIFLLIMFTVFHLTFSENFLFFGKWLNKGEGIVSFEGTAFEGLLANGGINSPGVIFFNLMDIATSSLSNLASSLLESSPAWVQGLIVDGVLGGIFAVLSFLPQILCLFLLFSILEDSGYMARVAFILDRMFRKFGLSGRAFMPLFMGFGCSVPAMINTRTLNDEKERLATIRVIPFFSCGAKLPILTAISGGIVQVFKVGNADIITYGMYLLGITSAIICLIIMRYTTLKGEASPFIMELPLYHAPKFKALMIHLWDKVKHFIKKAFTIILASTILIWVISHFTFTFRFLEESEMNLSILASIGKFLQPIFTPLGFGSQLSEFGWVFVVAAITGLIAKENVVATFGTLGACISVISGSNFIPNEALEGVDSVSLMISATGVSVSGLIAFIAFNMLTIPCFAAVATARGELTRKRFYATLIFWLVASFIISSLVYLTGLLISAIKFYSLLILLAIFLVAGSLYLIIKRMRKWNQ